MCVCIYLCISTSRMAFEGIGDFYLVKIEVRREVVLAFVVVRLSEYRYRSACVVLCWR